MNSGIQDVVQAIYVRGHICCHFPSYTRRVLNAIMLCEECLILLSNKAVEKEETFVKLFHKTIYTTMFHASMMKNILYSTAQNFLTYTANLMKEPNKSS